MGELPWIQARESGDIKYKREIKIQEGQDQKDSPFSRKRPRRRNYRE